MNPPLSPPCNDASRLLHEAAERLRRLNSCHRDPERFHIEKDQLVHDLRCIAYHLSQKRSSKERASKERARG
jgi:hypothetical protein